MNPPIFAFDYETYYRAYKKKKKDTAPNYSVSDLGNYGYTHHQEFDAYMLSVVGENGFRWVGNPKDFDWSIIQGAFMVAHNAGFEAAVTERLVELGIAPRDLYFADLVDTADLAAYLGLPRSLAQAATHLLGVTPDKSIRDKANGIQWKDMDPEFQKQMTAYGLEDSILELRLWLEHGHKWPEHERQVSAFTRTMCSEGLPVNVKDLDAALVACELLLAKIRGVIPWSEDPKTTPLSKKQVAIECEKENIAPPKSMAKDSEEFDEWLRVNGANLPWAKAMGQYRSVNIFVKKLQVMKLRTKADGTMPYGLKYAGAHTLRDSGESGWNPLNLPREPMFGDEMVQYELVSDAIDMRGLIEAPPGKMLGVVDLSAIEPCVLSVFSGDEELRLMLEGGMDPYEAQARIDGEYSDPRPLKDVDKDLRKFNKVKVLGCDYGAGPAKVQVIARQQVGLELTLEQCAEIVRNKRLRKFIPDLWDSLEEGMRSRGGRTFTIDMPSGGQMQYREIQAFGNRLSAVIPRKGVMMRLKYWGGTLCENIVQRGARDVFMDRVLALHAAGLPPILRVYDEAVCLLDEETAESDLATMIKIMSTKPAWMPELPLSADGHLCRKYRKG